MRLRMISRDGAGEVDSQPRKISWSITQSAPRSKAPRRSETSPYFRKLNRQIPELEPPLTLRKQRTANRSNRQKIQFCKNEISTQKLHASPKTNSLTEESDRHISNRELTTPRASAFRASIATRGICFALSNRELLGLEILQLAENKHRRPLLIANFEPSHRTGFRAFVAAAFLPRGTKGRRVGFPLSPAPLEPAGRPGKSSQRNSESK